MNRGEKVETLFLFIGSNGYGDEVPQRTGWDSVANKEGFIIVSPSGHVRHQGNFGNFDRYGGLKDSAGRSAWSDFTFMQETEGGKSVCTENEGTFNKYILKTSGGVPMFTGLEVLGLSHATVPTECTFAWETMSRFSKDPATKALYYNGSVVDTPVSSGK